ncbi:hypothetical protein AVEN_156235-1 [Araneus ventricosus]|uniref:Uncharacterized protein n=1 Tax=Araneus ventricosus TaxID=182803 RepID=A0A4Y2NP49_ARAVE|nr:hypothetical protein AVEN_138359-1 [Araneus ventricosus]GBN40704.1 hypothetical protein AVEN_156235-1 [Araneus ventricosus]
MCASQSVIVLVSFLFLFGHNLSLLSFPLSLFHFGHSSSVHATTWVGGDKLLCAVKNDYPYKNFSLQQICSSLALQVCSMCASKKLLQTSNSPYDKLAANLSHQVHCKPVAKRDYAYE